MQIMSIAAALRRNKLGAMLIGVQIAITLALVCNCLSIIEQRMQSTRRPTGIDESSVFTLDNQWIGDVEDLPARIKGDLAALRSLPGVIGVAATPSVPLTGRGSNGGVKLRPEQSQPTAYTGIYFVDEQGQAAFGTRLIVGRWFTAGEIRDLRAGDIEMPPVMIVTSTLANSLFPAGDALGHEVYLGQTPTRIIGIVERFETSMAASSWGEQFIENSILLPMQAIDTKLVFVVRTEKDRLAATMRAARSKLLEMDRSRIIRDVLPFQETRDRVYHGYRALSVMLAIVSGLLLVVTALGIVGITSYWVTQRRRHIGVRRALGACRIDILIYYHSENILICSAGAAVGILLALCGNLWIATNLAITRLGIGYISLGALIVLALSQFAVAWPALRAASVQPAIAARGA